MKKTEIVKMLQKCIYKRKWDSQKVSISTLKDCINIISGKHIYCNVETRLSKLRDD